jgi:hypothetical protein
MQTMCLKRENNGHFRGQKERSETGDLVEYNGISLFLPSGNRLQFAIENCH